MSVLSVLFVLSILSVLSVHYIRNWDIKGYMYGDGGYDMIEVLWQLKTSIYILWERILVHLRGRGGGLGQVYLRHQKPRCFISPLRFTNYMCFLFLVDFV